jgi:protein TonB
LVIGLHLAALVSVAHYTPVTAVPLQAPHPLMVTMIEAPAPPKVEVVPQTKPKPKPKSKKVVKKIPLPKAIHIHEESAPEPEPLAAAAPALKGLKSEAPPDPAPPRFAADYLNNPAPRYPALSRRLGEKGRVLLRVLVNAEGHPEGIQVNRSSGFSRLDSAAREAVAQWRFVPAKVGDRSVPAWVIVPIVFTLRG